jgi:hypothetical protein
MHGLYPPSSDFHLEPVSQGTSGRWEGAWLRIATAPSLQMAEGWLNSCPEGHGSGHGALSTQLPFLGSDSSKTSLQPQKEKVKSNSSLLKAPGS